MMRGQQRVVLTEWQCYDPECDCSQPQIVRYTKRPGIGYKIDVLAEGLFVSHADSDRAEEEEQSRSREALRWCWAGLYE